MINYTQRVLKAVLVAILAIASFCPQVSAATPDIKEKVTIAVKNVPMQQFFAEVEKQSNYSFFYSNAVLNGTPNVSISVKEVTDTIVTLRTVRSLNLQKIYPISSEPVLVVDNP